MYRGSIPQRTNAYCYTTDVQLIQYSPTCSTHAYEFLLPLLPSLHSPHLISYCCLLILTIVAPHSRPPYINPLAIAPLVLTPPGGLGRLQPALVPLRVGASAPLTPQGDRPRDPRPVPSLGRSRPQRPLQVERRTRAVPLHGPAQDHLGGPVSRPAGGHFPLSADDGAQGGGTESLPGRPAGLGGGQEEGGEGPPGPGRRRRTRTRACVCRDGQGCCDPSTIRVCTSVGIRIRVGIRVGATGGWKTGPACPIGAPHCHYYRHCV